MKKILHSNCAFVSIFRNFMSIKAKLSLYKLEKLQKKTHISRVCVFVKYKPFLPR